MKQRAAPVKRPLIHRLCAGLALGLVVLAGSGCSALKIADVSPWEKGNLARPEMTFEGNPLEAAYQEHIYASKESASGGAGVGGGGCGCN